MDQPGLGIGWKDDKRLTDLDFADDITLVAEQAHVCQQVTANLATHSVKLGLHISLEKTKIIQASQAVTSQPIYLGQTGLECVDQFTYYLGSVISKDGDVEKEVNTRLAKAATVFRRLSNIWKSGSLGQNIKLQLHTAVVVSTAVYASETWKSTRKIQYKLDVFHQRNLRKIIGVTRQGIKRRSTSTYWTETTAGHCMGKEIPLCGSCHADGTRTPSPPRN